MLWHTSLSDSTYIHRKKSSLGFTLLELLVAIALTLLVLTIVANVFKLVGDSVAANRNKTEMINRQRAVCQSLQDNLQQHTVLTIPWPRVGAGGGYIEYIEGRGTDKDPKKASFLSNSQDYALWIDSIEKTGDSDSNDLKPRIIGDVDDVLMMTCRTRKEPFRGRGPGGQIIESNLAEVIWYVKPDPSTNNPKPLTLYRRVLLIVPGLDISGGGSGDQFFQSYDISAHSQNNTMVPNTLADLTKPENRYAHDKVNNMGRFNPGKLIPLNESSGAHMSDVLLRNCVGFDIRAWDPEAKITGSESEAVAPGDLGYSGSGQTLGEGAYVDLNFLGRNSTYFSGPPHPLSKLHRLSGIAGVFDTWTFDYETDNIDQDGKLKADQGTNHLDDDKSNGVDDVGERETSPPYVVPLRGLEIRVRGYQASTRHVYQINVVGDFMPE